MFKGLANLMTRLYPWGLDSAMLCIIGKCSFGINLLLADKNGLCSRLNFICMGTLNWQSSFAKLLNINDQARNVFYMLWWFIHKKDTQTNLWSF